MSSDLSHARSAVFAYYPALTGLRAVAAYLIFFHHFRPDFVHEWARQLMGQLHVGVGLFFVLSGFVIASRYQGSVLLTRLWWRRYLWRRAARIYPVYFILNGAALAQTYWPILPGKRANSILLVLISQSLLRGFSSTLKFVGLPQGWTLTVEECFYLSAPLLLLAWQRWNSVGAVGFGVVTVSCGLLLTYICQDYPALHGLFGSYHYLFNYTFFGRVLEFGMGVGLARWWAVRPAKLAPRWPWRTFTGALLMIFVVSLLAKINSPIDWYAGFRYSSAIALNNLLFPAGVLLLLAGLLAEYSWLRTVLATPLLQVLGRSSYFFYLFHLGLFSIWWQARFGPGVHIAWQFLATVVMSEAGYRLFEEPLRRWVLVWALPSDKMT